MKVLMVGHVGVFNRGCEAIIRSTILMLKEKYPDLTVTLASFDYHKDSKHDFGFPVKVIHHVDTSVWDKGSLDWFKQKLVRLTGVNISASLLYKPIEQSVKDADIVLSIGGDNYTEDYGAAFLKNYLFLNEYVKKRGKRYLIWGASIGPFTEAGKAIGVVESLKGVDKIMVREDHTMDYLKSLGITNTVRIADPAFKLLMSKITLPDFLENKTKTVFGFNISPLLLWHRQNKSGSDTYRGETIAFLTELLTNQDIHLVLLPHVMDNGKGSSDDLHYMEQIYEDLPLKENIYLPREMFNCEQLKYIISKCDFYFGARTHTTIASLSAKVPTISIGYSVKAQGINLDIFGHQDYVLKSTELTYANLMSKYALLRSKEIEIRNQLEVVIPKIKGLSEKALNYLEA